jgi:hypothetical protein
MTKDKEKKEIANLTLKAALDKKISLRTIMKALMLKN